MTLEQLYLEAARVAELEKQYPGIYPIKFHGNFYNSGALIIGIINWRPYISEIEFALAIVEGKPVFKGDRLWCQVKGDRLLCQVNGNYFEACVQDHNRSFEHCSWNKPKPKTVMVEMLVEAAEFMVSAYCVEAKFKSATSEVAESCRKALEGLKS